MTRARSAFLYARFYLLAPTAIALWALGEVLAGRWSWRRVDLGRAWDVVTARRRAT